MPKRGTAAAALALASHTLSVARMEDVGNALMLPGNRGLIARGRGHTLAHEHHY